MTTLRIRAVSRISTALALGIALISCATSPTKVKEIEHSSKCKSNLAELSLGELLERSLIDPASPDSTHALAHFVTNWKRTRGDSDGGELTSPGGRQFRVHFSGSRGDFPLTYFDKISPAVDYRVKKLPHYHRDGIGAPLVAIRENLRVHPIEDHYPDEGIARPITAVARWKGIEDGVENVEVDLISPLQTDRLGTNGDTETLAADFTVPWAILLARTRKLGRSRVKEAFELAPNREPRLYLMEPYDPEKEPLIMIHGLYDTPLIWAEMSNELWADDAIRSRYQIWHFVYNTAAPAIYSGRMLREHLEELRPQLDPTGQDPAMQSTTVIAHSMGAIVTRCLITRPGNAFFDEAFTQSFESLKLSDEDRSRLHRAFFWEPEPHVKRVIYIAASHKGSDYADNLVGRLGTALTNPPNQFKAFYERISSANPGAFTPIYAKLGTGELDSVGALSPKQPALETLANLPNSHPVREFSIIANRGRSGPIEKSSDGVVPYWSSHIDRAESEKIVPTGHYPMNHEETVAEVKRILTLP